MGLEVDAGALGLGVGLERLDEGAHGRVVLAGHGVGVGLHEAGLAELDAHGGEPVGNKTNGFAYKACKGAVCWST